MVMNLVCYDNQLNFALTAIFRTQQLLLVNSSHKAELDVSKIIVDKINLRQNTFK